MTAPPAYVEKVVKRWSERLVISMDQFHHRPSAQFLAETAVETLLPIPVVGQGVQLSGLGFTVGRWSPNLQHDVACDCDHDEETAGDRCLDRSVWCWALLRDEGGFAPSFAFPLSDFRTPSPA